MDIKLMDDDFICILYEATEHYLRFEQLSVQMATSNPEYFVGFDAQEILARHEAQVTGAKNTLNSIWENKSEVLKARGFEKIK